MAIVFKVTCMKSTILKVNILLVLVLLTGSLFAQPPGAFYLTGVAKITKATLHVIVLFTTNYPFTREELSMARSCIKSRIVYNLTMMGFMKSLLAEGSEVITLH